MSALHRIVNEAITDGFCRWCRVLVGSEGHKATSECPVAIAEEELREAPAFLPDSDLDDILALVDSVHASEPASVPMALDDVRALVAECRAGRAKGAAVATVGDRYQAGYRAALAYVVEQLRYEASDKADAGAEITLRDFAESVEEWSADADPLVSARTATSALAWECRNHGDHVCAFGPVTIHAQKSAADLLWHGSAWAFGRGLVEHIGPFATAPEAARAAVEALRAIVEPVVEQLSRVPDLEMP